MVILVFSINDLQSAIKNANANDTIVLANNTYCTDSTITIAKNGISVIAQTPGQVIFQGGSIAFVITGNNNTLSGFQFIYGATTPTTRPTDLIQIRGNNNIIQNMNFNGFYVEHSINIYNQTQNNQVLNCNFQGKPVDKTINGSQIQIQADPNIIGNHRIAYCTFQKMIGKGGDFGNEPIRLGEGCMSTYDLGTVVEYCVFDNTQLADSESISVKSRKNVIRYNTFRNNQNAMVSFRNGDFNVAYGNFFIGSGGIKIKQASNIYVYNNYFENCTCPVSFIDVSMYPNPSTYQNNVVFQYNNFIGCGAIALGTSTTQVGNAFYSNILYNTSISAITNNLVTVQGNLYWKSTGYSFDTTTNQNIDPLLTLNSNGYFSASLNVPVVKEYYPLNHFSIPNIDIDPNMQKDITTGMRPSSKAIGCTDAVTSIGSPNVPLTVTSANVGVSYSF